MNINSITGMDYQTSCETGRIQRNRDGKDITGAAVNTQNVSQGGFTLHYSKSEEGDTPIGAWTDNENTVSVYKPKNFDPTNPVYKVKTWDKAGNVTERMVDISTVDPENCDAATMYAYSCYLSNSGKCQNAERAFMGAYENQHDIYSSDIIEADTVNWLNAVKSIMQMQYNAGNLKGYLDYKQFYDYLN